jgi:hypothetical protein
MTAREKERDMAGKINQATKITIDPKKSSKRDIVGPDLVKDGGKWAGSGKKVVEHAKGPVVAAQHQSQTGRGALRTTVRQPKSKHPSQGWLVPRIANDSQDNKGSLIMPKSTKASRKIETAKHPGEKSKRKAKDLASPSTRGKNQAGQTNGQSEMIFKERGKSNSTSAGGAPRQIY